MDGTDDYNSHVPAIGHTSLQVASCDNTSWCSSAAGVPDQPYSKSQVSVRSVSSCCW